MLTLCSAPSYQAASTAATCSACVAACLEEEAELQAALVVQMVSAAHMAIHVGHAQGKAVLCQGRKLGGSHRLLVPCLPVCPVGKPHVPVHTGCCSCPAWSQATSHLPLWVLDPLLTPSGLFPTGGAALQQHLWAQGSNLHP